MDFLLKKILKCTVCKENLPLGPRPVVQLNKYSRIVIISQAPSRRVHETGIPWNDASGNKLRAWLNVDEATFYNPGIFSILPMGFCYPGKGVSGDLPPRPECAPLWHPQVMKHFKNEPLIILIGQYAQRYYLKKDFKGNLTDTVKNYAAFLPRYFPLPHPSPRNQNWLLVNPWFLNEAIPVLQQEIKTILQMDL
ncbi:MAG: uracil-DNA glycosylase family protein [Bacteroidetes bacterium]|nr:uracil-DNA glycosylase family protein [Bacteroidota bacterium]